MCDLNTSIRGNETSLNVPLLPIFFILELLCQATTTTAATRARFFQLIWNPYKHNTHFVAVFLSFKSGATYGSIGA